MNNPDLLITLITFTVAIFAAVASAVAHKVNLSHRCLLMPLAVGSLMSGMMTLVATSSHIAQDNALFAQVQKRLSFLSFSPINAIACSVAFISPVGSPVNMIVRESGS